MKAQIKGLVLLNLGFIIFKMIYFFVTKKPVNFNDIILLAIVSAVVFTIVNITKK